MLSDRESMTFATIRMVLKKLEVAGDGGVAADEVASSFHGPEHAEKFLTLLAESHFAARDVVAGAVRYRRLNSRREVL